MRCGTLSIFLILLAICPAACGTPNTAFLDDPVPASLIPPPTDPTTKSNPAFPFVQFNSLADRVTNLQAVAPIPILFPTGLVEFIRTEDAATDWDAGHVFLLTERDGSPSARTARDYITLSLRAMDLAWAYDPARKTIVCEFGWQRHDSRATAQLLNVLMRAPSTATKPLWLSIVDLSCAWLGANTETDLPDPYEVYYFRHHQLDPGDEWRIAFDALLSKPENYPHAWKLRFLDDQRKHFSGALTLNLLVSPMRDFKGAPHVIVINNEPEFSSPGEGYVSYYVFDPEGRFELGGIVGSGHRCWNTTARVDATGGVLKLRTFFNGSQEEKDGFILNEHGLAPLKSVDPGLGIGQIVYATDP